MKFKQSAGQYFQFDFFLNNSIKSTLVWWSIHKKTIQEQFSTSICLEIKPEDEKLSRYYFIHWTPNCLWKIDQWYDENQRWLNIEQTENLKLLMETTLSVVESSLLKGNVSLNELQVVD